MRADLRKDKIIKPDPGAPARQMALNWSRGCFSKWLVLRTRAGLSEADERVHSQPKMALELVYGADLIIIFFICRSPTRALRNIERRAVPNLQHITLEVPSRSATRVLQAFSVDCPVAAHRPF